jgi:hypothetical protein
VIEGGWCCENWDVGGSEGGLFCRENYGSTKNGFIVLLAILWACSPPTAAALTACDGCCYNLQCYAITAVTELEPRTVCVSGEHGPTRVNRVEHP